LLCADQNHYELLCADFTKPMYGNSTKDEMPGLDTNKKAVSSFLLKTAGLSPEEGKKSLAYTSWFKASCRNWAT
jgi:hypothetical protein